MVVTEGPLLVEGPVEVVGRDGTVSVSERFVVAICTCRGSRSYPWCDTSHRRRRGRAAGGGRGKTSASGSDVAEEGSS
nr:CDGSH iron-sulfur domain-containing protein [Streptomyces sp. NRRL F-4489]